MELYNYKVMKVVKVVDGDTVYVNASLGFNVTFKVELRLLDVDTPELRDKDPIMKAFAKHMKKFVKNWCKDLPLKDEKVFVVTKKRGKYGRWLGDIFAEWDDNREMSLVESIKLEMVAYKKEHNITWQGRY